MITRKDINNEATNDFDTNKLSAESLSDLEHEIFLFNESSFANLFDSSKFNTIDDNNKSNNDINHTTFMNLLSQSEKSFKLLGTDEDFYSELENLKHLELSSFDLENDADMLPESSTVSSPRFNSLMNSVTSMDLMDNDDLKYEFSEDEKLINESIITSCTLTNDLNVSSSNISESNSSNSNKNSTPIQKTRRKMRTVSLRTKLLSKSSNTSLIPNSPNKSKKFLPRCERNRIANQFYKRKRITSSDLNWIVKFNESILSGMSKNLKLASYKQPTKVEKLLNDSRGMRKYLIDYDGLMTHKKNLTNLTYASLLNITNVTSLSPGPSSPKVFVNSLKSISCSPKFGRLCGGSSNSSFNKSVFKSKLKCHTRNSTMLGNIYFDDSRLSGNSANCSRLSSNRCSSGYLTEC